MGCFNNEIYRIMDKRCFIAINIPDDVKKDIETYIETLKSINDKNIRFVQLTSLHITLHFLGNLEENKIQEVINLIKDVSSHHNVFQLVTGNISCFPNLARPRIVYIDNMDIRQNALVLQRELGERLDKVNIKTDTRVWTPHITIARIKFATSFHVPNISLKNSDFSVTSADLMESRLTSLGPIYSCIDRGKLRV